MQKSFLFLIILFAGCSAMALFYISERTEVKYSSEHGCDFVDTEPNLRPYSMDFFAWPLKGKIDLAGNFGELRTNHFHSGLDLRTGEGKTGIPVYAAGDGYIGRINISAKGYGKALYIIHPNGYTSVYGHLSAFVPAVADYIVKNHYIKKSFEMELFPEPDLMRVKKGELVAYSGNTGGSAGPHLHFEIRDTETSDAINPLLFGLKLDDNIKPQINAMTLYALDNTNHLKTGTYRYTQYARSGKTLSYPELNVYPGIYAFGASWTDHLRSGGFRMGIPYAKLYVNGQLVFEQKIERIPFGDWRLINCHLDHPVLEEKELKIIKLFVDDGNTLKFYPHAINRGRLNVENCKSYLVKLVIRDFSGHRDSITFKVHGKKEGTLVELPERVLIKDNPFWQKQLFYPQRLNILEMKTDEAAMKVEIPIGVLYDTVLFRIGPTPRKINGNSVWDVMSSNIPINDSFTISFKPVNPSVTLEKYIIIRLTKKGAKKPEATLQKNGYLVAKAKMLGQFYYDIDTIAPLISTVKVTGRRFSAGVSDNLSGIKEISTAIDGHWILTDYEPKSDFISGIIPGFIKEGKHELTIKVTDTCGNTEFFKQSIII